MQSELKPDGLGAYISGWAGCFAEDDYTVDILGGDRSRCAWNGNE